FYMSKWVITAVKQMAVCSAAVLCKRKLGKTCKEFLRTLLWCALALCLSFLWEIRHFRSEPNLCGLTLG
ncbi:hypothetical protein HPB47_016560, partial [Ixodes persulcatus]